MRLRTAFNLLVVGAFAVGAISCSSAQAKLPTPGQQPVVKLTKAQIEAQTGLKIGGRCGTLKLFFDKVKKDYNSATCNQSNANLDCNKSINSADYVMLLEPAAIVCMQNRIRLLQK